MKKRHISYGGALTGDAEEKAIIKSIKLSRKTRNWQQAAEGKKMEEETARALGVTYSILTNSGSSAGLLALAALELPKGSEVIIPATTFPTIFNIIPQCGLRPVVVDTKVGTYNLDPDELESAITKNTKAVIVVHALGNPVDMRKVMKIAKKHKLYVVEDNCDGWGTMLGGKPIGSFADISFTSFHAAHIVSMGVGGGVFTDNPKLARNVRMYRDWGRQAVVTQKLNGKRWPNLPEDYDSRFIYEKVGYNFQILELQAAMGRVQLRQAGKIKRMRKSNFDFLYKHLSQYKDDLVLPTWPKDADVCWFAFPLSVKGKTKRADLIAHLEERGIETRSMFAGNITKHPAYTKDDYRIGTPLKEADIILRDSFWISVHPRLSADDRAYMRQAFDDFFKRRA
ncbi:MAG: aminotransferase class I/II-fold pyridoxal phosphate-dependent enzyme [Candidatus Pacebacteria bacterium]|nr:aminotransferase class I/II-fold pyridoxal phosphate-dependent enzyme [Candidatus Paceibacterota bacterium]